MNKLIGSFLVSSFAVIQPINASEILPSIQKIENPKQFLEQILCPNGVYDASKARRFIFQLKRELKDLHNIDLDLNTVIAEAIKNVQESGQFSEVETKVAKEFYLQLIDSESAESRVSNAWLFGKKEHKHKDKKKKAQELVLPDKMAMGWVLLFSGALLSLLPFGVTQGLAVGMIGSGIYTIMDGAREGEKPYYLDNETGQITPITLDPTPSVSIGKEF